MATQKKRRDRRTFSVEFKQQILELIGSGEKSAAQVCREFDLTSSTVANWVKADRETNGIMTQNSLSETDQQELDRLRAENKRLKTEREILKKATAFWVKESQ